MERCKTCAQCVPMEHKLYIELKRRKRMTITEIEDFLYPLPDGKDLSLKMLGCRRSNTLKVVSRIQRRTGTEILRRAKNSEYVFRR